MRKIAWAAVGAAITGAVVFGAGPAGAATQSEQVVAVVGQPAPSCVNSVYWANNFFGFLRTEMTNNCADVQRVRSSFNYTFTPEPTCYELQPGQQAVYMKTIVPAITAGQYKFQGLVTC